jgi:type I restriction enzyme R subunit
MDLLSSILASFQDMWGNIDWKNEDQVKRHIAGIPAAVSKDTAYQHAMKNSDKQNARIESERALKRAVINMMTDNMELFKQYNDNPPFKKWLSNMVFNLTYNTKGEVFDGDMKKQIDITKSWASVRSFVFIFLLFHVCYTLNKHILEDDD